jgi:alkenylglycerophosphocholine/alkenylglycerophosphoethanolamine hydrolase
MAKEIVLFTIYSTVHLLAIYIIPRESIFFLPSKIIPILVLIFFLANRWSDLQRKGKFVLLGLVFSLFGDSFLALPGSGYFVPGLGSFLVAQLVYSYAFSLGSKVSLPLFLPFIVFGLIFFYFLAPKLGPLLVPVGVYITAICLMGWRSSARVAPKNVYLLGLLGALIFMVSDSIIAYSMFLNPEMDRSLASLLIMITYYIAQLLIYSATKAEELNLAFSKST